MPSTVGPLFALKGKVKEDWSADPWVNLNQVVIETQGGEFYCCEVASPFLREKLTPGQEETVYVVQIIREDAESLYIFENILERSLFLEVREFDSVGPKTAALLMSSLGADGIRDLMERGQKPGTKITGLGPKTFEKILVGLKQNKEKFLELFAKAQGQHRNYVSQSANGSLASYDLSGDGAPLDVIQAMEKLGLRQNDIHNLWIEVTKEVADFKSLGNVDKIRHLLQAWGRNKTRIYQSGEL